MFIQLLVLLLPLFCVPGNCSNLTINHEDDMLLSCECFPTLFDNQETKLFTKNTSCNINKFLFNNLNQEIKLLTRSTSNENLTLPNYNNCSDNASVNTNNNKTMSIHGDPVIGFIGLALFTMMIASLLC